MTKKWPQTPIKIFHFLENSLSVLAVILMAGVLFAEVVIRKAFDTGVPYSTDYTHHLVLILTFVAGMITSRDKKHLSLTLSWDIKEPVKTRLETTLMVVAVMLTTGFCWSSLSFVLTNFGADKMVGIFPIRFVGMVMVVGYAVMAFRFIIQLPKGPYRWIAAGGILLGTFIALSSFSEVLAYLFDGQPAFMESFVSAAESVNGAIAVPLIIFLIISAVFGMPLFVVLGGVAYLLYANGGDPLVAIPDEAYILLTDHSIPAIPLFTVAGFILSESKAGERLVRFFKAFFGWIPGGLAIVAVLVCAFFTTFTGASGVTILALGALLSFVLAGGKYKRKFNVGLLTASGSVGLLFPPSLPIIIYGVIAGISIKEMFLGGIIPGVVMVLALVIFSVFYAMKNKTERIPFNFSEAVSSFLGAIWEILLPVVILIGLFGGYTLLVESAAIAVVYALVVEVFVHRDIKIMQIPKVILKCIPIIGGVLIILSMAKGLNSFIVDAEVPTMLMAWVKANIHSKYIFLLLLNIMLLITGCLMDIFSAIMVVVPLIIPLGELFGIAPVHLGIIFLANMELGYMTPPVGLNLFLASYRFEEPMSRLYKDVMPFFLIQLVAVLLITYVPVLTTALL